jgi:hypothetical protein
MVEALRDASLQVKNGWSYCETLAETTGDPVAWQTLRFLALEYGAVELLPGCRAARLLDTTDYDNHVRHYSAEFPWPAER